MASSFLVDIGETIEMRLSFFALNLYEFTFHTQQLDVQN